MLVDTLFKGGTVIDGAGGPPYRADVGVTNGFITYIALAEPGPSAPEIVDCSGMIVAPGFIDIHTHSDLTVVADPSAQSAVLQGVTTHVVGNCGFSPFPVNQARKTLLADHIAGIGGETVQVNWMDVAGYAATLAESPPAINVVALVGHGALRIAAMADPYGPADDNAVRAMRLLLANCLEQGAAGMSTGLTYQPSALAGPSEIHALAAECAARGRIYATHARATAENEYAAISESIAVSAATGVRLEHSHVALNNPAHWGHTEEILRQFERAEGKGLPVGFDVYPYDASASSALQYLPAWVQRGGSAELAARAADPSWRAAAAEAIGHGFFGGIPWQWDRIVLSAAPGMTQEVGHSFAEIAEMWHCPGEQVLLDVCIKQGSAAQVVLYYRTEQDMRAFLSHPLSVLGSDGLARPLDGVDHPHPRSFGAFPRMLGRYVREAKLLDLSAAVRKMSGEPARRLNLGGRGEIRKGFVADLVVFRADEIADRASFTEPRLAPVGIARTVVGGTTVARDGKVLAARPGIMVRCGE